ncbi:glycoside hydrolase family 5 protein [Novipirellula artificiosorum]|uniref:Endoglucanase n=1 Tax=Novipirellula artificiosorum TaxID=2528016 RepID=A0A5C6D2F8_9BACT|nr:cellulase family glycosylhydrolase [Novipirellula artificiosorum]TWU31373.1 Endoglucanase precursor [Novipirellula artificiosorum]
MKPTALRFALVFIQLAVGLLCNASELFVAAFEDSSSLSDWSKSGAESDSFAISSGALRITQPNPGGTAVCRQEIPIDGPVPELVTLSAKIKAENVSEKPNHHNGVKVMLVVETDRGIEYPQLSLPDKSFDWSTAKRSIRLPRDTRKLTLSLGLEKCTGTVWFDKVRIDLGRMQSKAKQLGTPFRGHNLPRLRGVMHGPDFDEKSFEDLAAWGANQIRWQLNWTPMKPAEQWAKDLDAYDDWLDSILDDTDKAVDACEKYRIAMLLDLHCPPGGRGEGGVCRMFQEKQYQDKFLDIWRKLATRYKGRDIIYAYDLINEPVEPGLLPDGLLDWRELATEATKAIRQIDPGKPVVFEPGPWGSCNGFDEMVPLDVNRVIYSFHMYQPHSFTHQFQQKDRYPNGLVYPGKVDGVYWDRAKLLESMKPALDFERDFNVPIYVGEFSAIRWAPDESAYRYLIDLIELFEQQRWDWSYHAFREFHGWSVEHSTNEREKTPTVTPTKREQLLRKWFALSEQFKRASGSGRQE